MQLYAIKFRRICRLASWSLLCVVLYQNAHYIPMFSQVVVTAKLIELGCNLTKLTSWKHES